MRRSSTRLADGREIIYFDDTPDAPPRTAQDTRDLPIVPPCSQLRRDPLTHEWVAIAEHRQTRPDKPPAELCPLCPSRPGSPTEIPASDYDVAVFENRFPSLNQSASLTPSTVPGMPLVRMAPGRGHCEIICFTSDHRGSFGELSRSRVRTVVDVWAERTEMIGRLPGVRQVFPFENRGEEIGVTLHHPHGQIYGYPFVTPRTKRMLSVARAYLAAHGRPVLGDVLAAERADGARLVATGDHWTAFVPAAARWPVEVHLVPHRQVPDLPALNDAERDEFADFYPRLLRRLDALYGRPLPYVAAWHQAPVRRGRALAWLHLQIISVRRTVDRLKYLAASESAMAVWINDVNPERLAQRLRHAGAVRTSG